MTQTHQIRLGLVGLGAMGGTHAKRLQEGMVPTVQLTALCDPHPTAAERFPQLSGLPWYRTPEELFARESLDALLVATPHGLHTDVGVAALDHGLHVLVEKPMSSSKAGCEALLCAQERSGKVLSVMLNMRTKPIYAKIRQLLVEGELGTIRRAHWTASNWFRTDAYYRQSSWRGTWAGEGGGVLLNQCPHQLDLLCWFFGLPQRVTAFCQFGRYHAIETEDDVTAVLHYPDAMKVVFVASTGEAPGTDRLEIVGDRGRLIAEQGRLRFDRNRQSMSDYSRNAREAMERPECWSFDVPLTVQPTLGHLDILDNFARAILDGDALIAPASEAIHSVELANAMQYATWTESTVRLPLDAAAYESRLRDAISGSAAQKNPS